MPSSDTTASGGVSNHEAVAETLRTAEEEAATTAAVSSAAASAGGDASGRRLLGSGGNSMLASSATRSLSTAANRGAGDGVGAAERGQVVHGPSCKWPGWQTRLAQKKVAKQGDQPGSCDKAVSMDGLDSPHTSFTTRGLVS